ncbi:ABC transporter permease [Oceanivirga salmonicida]|uniref:ABC transporter permease n=1 Tax=Oceanivirga salmonicida TaxID=1769291 RepID=UPI0012E0F72E|nr:ABC transporter permease [Oceanivirga salmonicida]
MKKFKLGRETGIITALVVLIIIFSIINPIYLSSSNIIDIVKQSTINGLLALGMTLVIITAGIDLSVGSIFAISIVSVGQFLNSGMSINFLVFLGLFIGFILGAINGFLITKAKLQPFIVTLGTMSIYRGISYIITGGWPVLDISENFRKLYDGDLFDVVPISVIILFLTAIIMYFILKYTKFGIYIYALGSNEEATRLSGVNVDFNKLMVYGISGITASLAGIILLARLGTGEPTAGIGYELNAIAAAAVGGTSLSGGKGSILGTILGTLLLSALRVGLIVVGVDSFWQYIATGIIIIIAASFEIIHERIKTLKLRRK